MKALHKSFLSILTFFLIITIIVGCDHSEPSSSNKNIKAKIAILTWVGYGPFFVAREKGFFEKYGLDIEIVKIEELGARHSALISGAVQFSISTLDLFANEAAQGLPAKCFVKLDDSYGGDGIVAKKEIRSIKELKGKTVAFEKANPSHFFLIYFLQKEGLSIKDIKPKYMTAGDAGAAFVAGQVDAAVTWEPWLTKANESKFGHILVTSREKPGLIVDVLLVHKSFVEQHPDSVKGMLKAWFEAVDFCMKNAKESNEIMSKGLGLSEEDFAEMVSGIRFSDYEENIKYFDLNNTGDNPCSQVFEEAQKIWFQEGIIDTKVGVDEFIDSSFLDDLYK